MEKLSGPSPGDLLDPGLEPVSPVSPALAGGGFTTESPKKLPFYLKVILFFLPCLTACGILVPQPVTEPMSPALEMQSLNHWTTKEVLEIILNSFW